LIYFKVQQISDKLSYLKKAAKEKGEAGKQPLLL